MCAEERPVDAIHYEDDLPPEQLSFQQINAEYFRHHPLEPVTVAAPTKARACPPGSLQVAPMTLAASSVPGGVVPGVYGTGWVESGPRGVIGTNRPCAAETASQLLADFDDGKLTSGVAAPEKTQRPARAAQCDPADMETLAEHRRRGAQAGCRNRQTPNEIRRCRRDAYGCNVIHSPPHGIVRAVTTAQHEGNSFDD
ncbi:putative ferredoxin-NADP reductase [Mycobacterium intracellulare 1956]|uniref:Putative ferredoxin-NADP reductase n=1 Tax=Mycobacterium intracellulare 1956 TaxID=1299331 RepID=X8CQ12_MYCIT|nr:putative ferredoxin-NADP reductase [Mycobacterium intracellulare]EUA57335.1 putative ferredoxin-NADP reductase [Mycobacterium intracellulare 1956]